VRRSRRNPQSRRDPVHRPVIRDVSEPRVLRRRARPSLGESTNLGRIGAGPPRGVIPPRFGGGGTRIRSSVFRFRCACFRPAESRVDAPPSEKSRFSGEGPGRCPRLVLFPRSVTGSVGRRPPFVAGDAACASLGEITPHGRIGPGSPRCVISPRFEEGEPAATPRSEWRRITERGGGHDRGA
jgi:hypothetical protein